MAIALNANVDICYGLPGVNHFKNLLWFVCMLNDIGDIVTHRKKFLATLNFLVFQHHQKRTMLLRYRMEVIMCHAASLARGSCDGNK